MSKNLTRKQKERLEKAAAKLPEGWKYSLRDEAAAPKYYTGVWGVDVYDASGDSVGNVSRTNGQLSAMTYCCSDNDELVADVRLALNRAAAALWHKQPSWT